MRERRLCAFLPVSTGVLLTGMLLAPVAADAAPFQAGDNTTLPSADPIEWSAPQVRSMAFPPSGRGAASMPERRTKEFSLLGVTWTNPNAAVAGTVQVRTRHADTGTWTGWTSLETAEQSGESGPGVRGGTDPLWVGRSDGVDARVVTMRTASATAPVARLSRLPKGLRISLVDPGQSMSPAGTMGNAGTATAGTGTAGTGTAGTGTAGTGTAGTGTAGTTGTTPNDWPAWASTPSPTGTLDGPATGTLGGPATGTLDGSAAGALGALLAPSLAPQPPIINRAGWGADESISPEDPIYLPDAVKAVVVHHTAGTNNYSCANSAALIRGIYNYDVRSRGYRDIGYNFLVDKCGTIFEGRKGGVEQAVYGAHARGWNSQTVGISVLGNFNTAAPSTATLTALAQVAAWKLGQYGADPAGEVSMVAGDDDLHNYYSRYFTKGTAYTFPRIVGHRDVNNTECPGTNLHAKLPTIRGWAAGPAKDFKVTSLTGVGKSGSTYYSNGGLTVSWSTSTPSSLITRFDLIIDDVAIATVGGSDRSATLALPLGNHQVQVRAVHALGKTATTPRIAVVAETTPPTFTTAPNVSLRAETVNTSAVPVKLAWKATDNTVLKNVQLTTPTALTFAPATLSWPLTARSGTATTWAMAANDYAGNTAMSSTTATPIILQETSGVRSGTWRTKTSTNYLGGKSYTSSTRGSAIAWTFTGRSAAWVVSRATGSGRANVYVDGKRTGTIELYSPTTRYRNIIWTKTWPTSATHTVRFVVIGTSGRPAITTDGFVYLR